MERDPSAAKEGYSAQSYIWALEDGLIPIYELLDIYQMDNTPIHTSKLVREWLERHSV
jgi:hypothetical protein